MSFIRKLIGVGNKNEPITIGMILFNRESSFPPFQPVIVMEKELKTKDPGSPIGTISLFPTKLNGARNSQILNGENVIGIDPKRVLDNRKVLTIDRFNFDKVQDLSLYVKEAGAISLVIDNASSGAEFITNLSLFKEIYRYSANLGKKHDLLRRDYNDDIIRTVISIYDLPYTIPIFDAKKADGLGVHIAVIWRDYTERNERIMPLGEMFFAMNQYKRNLLVVDGAKAFNNGLVDHKHQQQLCSLLSKEAKRQCEYKKTAKGPKKTASNNKKDCEKKKNIPSPQSPTIDYVTVSTSSKYYMSPTSSATTTC